MGRIGYNHLLASHIATRTVIVVDGHQARQLTMCASVWLKGEMSQTREFTKRAFKHLNQFLRTICGVGRLFWMQVLELRQRCHLLIDFGIVLHRTRAQRIESRINAKVVVRQIGIMAHHRQLITFRQTSILRTLHRDRNLVITIEIAGQTVTHTSFFGQFENQFSV